MPQRLQRSRKRGAHLPEGTICVDRTSRYGNPYSIPGLIRLHPELTEDDARILAVNSYRDWLAEADPDLPDVYVDPNMREHDRRWIQEHLAALKGRDLACYCPLPTPGETDWCHAAVLLELANP